jgi:FkbM family methyltransferase
MASEFSDSATDQLPNLADALALLGSDTATRYAIFDLLRRLEARQPDPRAFREGVRWPLIASMLQDGIGHEVQLDGGLRIEVHPDSRIERALLLSPNELPHFVWEPQTTRLLSLLAEKASNTIVGGAYIGDQAIFMARAAHARNGRVHAFEPMQRSFEQLQRNIQINGLDNVTVHRLALWDRSDVGVRLDGSLALAYAVEDDGSNHENAIGSLSIDDYVEANSLSSVGLITLDVEGNEEKALLGAKRLTSRPPLDAPNIVFEVHRSYVDWTNGLLNTAIVSGLISQGYEAFAIRDGHGEYLASEVPLEVIPADSVYLDGPPHGFNMLATKDKQLVGRMGLQVVAGVSPKLLYNKDPALHHPVGGWKSPTP